MPEKPSNETYQILSYGSFLFTGITGVVFFSSITRFSSMWFSEGMYKKSILHALIRYLHVIFYVIPKKSYVYTYSALPNNCAVTLIYLGIFSNNFINK